MPPAGEAKEEGSEKTKAAAAPGGIKAWLPLILTVVTMPLLAFATTRFVLIPKLAKSAGQPEVVAAVAAAEPAAEAKGKEKEKTGAAAGKAKTSVQLNKLLVNVAGTMGTRYLMTSVTLVGTDPDFHNKIDENHDQLMDLATGTLRTKTIADLEKPGALNVIRAELMTVFNNALGGPLVQEIYITELAIQ